MLKLIPFGILIFAIFITLGCTSPGDSASTNKTGNRLEKDIPEDSPIGVLRAFTDAKKNSDIKRMKETLSKGTLETVADVAEGNGKSLDEFLLPGNTTPLNRPNMPETRNEQVDGAIATVEISRFPGDKWRKLTFVREEGRWKMDLNRYMDELYPNMKENTSGPPPPPPSR